MRSGVRRNSYTRVNQCIKSPWPGAGGGFAGACAGGIHREPPKERCPSIMTVHRQETGTGHGAYCRSILHYLLLSIVAVFSERPSYSLYFSFMKLTVFLFRRIPEVSTFHTFHGTSTNTVQVANFTLK